MGVSKPDLKGKGYVRVNPLTNPCPQAVTEKAWQSGPKGIAEFWVFLSGRVIVKGRLHDHHPCASLSKGLKGGKVQRMHAREILFL